MSGGGEAVGLGVDGLVGELAVQVAADAGSLAEGEAAGVDVVHQGRIDGRDEAGVRGQGHAVPWQG